MAKTYLTVQGDMFDSIAHREMGSAAFAPELMKANERYREVYIFSGGVELTIPASPALQTTDDSGRLRAAQPAPWVSRR